MKILGAIVAGGASSRMGREKALMPVDGISLIERVASRIRFQVDDLVINANGDPQRFAHLPYTVIVDLIDVGTPLAGLHACLCFAADDGYDAVVTVPSDTPLLPLDLVERLRDGGTHTGAAHAKSAYREHYMTGIWTTAMAKPLERLIREQHLRRVQDFCAKAKSETVTWSDHPHDPFFNVNTPEDVETVIGILRGA
jgi:molybdenum cofactor guanylyltransferase